MRLRLLLSPFVALLPVLALSGAPASAQASPCAPGGPTAQYPPSACGLALGKTEVRPGESLSVSGAGYRANSTVSLEFRSAPSSLGSAQAGAGGAFSTSVTIPADATPGAHTIAATGVDASGAARELTGTVTVLGAVATRGGDLPRTGASFALPAGLAGAVLLAVGSVAVLASRRRRTAT